MSYDTSESRLQFGTLTLIPDERVVLKDGHALSLTPKAFDLLVVLASNPGHLLTKQQLMTAVWPDAIVEESNLTYHIFALRKALGEGSDTDPTIETVPKRGYRFVCNGGQPDLRARDEPASAPLPREIRRPLVAVGLGLGLVALTLAGFSQLRHEPAPATALLFQDAVPGRLAESGMFSVSPDGKRLVFAAEGADHVLRLWVRTMSALRAVALPGTEVFTIVANPVWAPDSRSLAFQSRGALRKVGVDGGAPQIVCPLTAIAVGGSWNADGDILLGNAEGGLLRCPATGGRATRVTVPTPGQLERHISPSFLSDGRHFLYLRLSLAKPENSGIYMGDLAAPSTAAGLRLVTTGFGATFVPSTVGGPGWVVFARDGAVFAQRFDERRLEMSGDPIRVADGVGSYLAGAYYSASPTTLVYRAPDPNFVLTWFDRGGRELSQVGSPARFTGLALSPNGDRALVSMHAPQGTTDQDLWLFDLAHTALPQRITFGPELERGLVWSTNDRFAFGSGGGASGVYEQTVGGPRRMLFKSGRPEQPSSMSADGRILLYSSPGDSGMGGGVWAGTAEGAKTVVRPLLGGVYDQWQAELSPDGHWVAYVSNGSGPNEVFVTESRVDSRRGPVTFGASMRVSEGGGVSPHWRRDGRELLYLTPDGSVMSIEMDTKRPFRPHAAKRLFSVPGVLTEWGVTADGSRFLFAVPTSGPPPFTFVQNWQAALRK